jgi:hypothetical protein
MFTLEDLYNLPNNPTDDHKVAAGLLPKPQPPPAAPPLTNVPPVSPVTPRPAVDWKAKIAATAPTPGKTIPEMAPVNPSAPGTPNLGTGIPEDTSGVQAAATGKIPELPKLGFKERQALPLTSEGVAPNSQGYWQAEQQRLIDQKQNPWGSEENHPGLLGKIGHVAAKIGNIAGDIVAPGIMANIPGTEMNKDIQLGRAEGKEAKVKEAESQQKLRSAETDEAEARARKLAAEGHADIVEDAAGNAVAWRDKDGNIHSPDEEGTPPAIKSTIENWQGKAGAKPQKENLQQGLAGAVQDYLDKGGDPKGIQSDPTIQGWGDLIKNFTPAKEKDVNTAEDLKHQIVVATDKGDGKEVARLTKELMALNPEAQARLAESYAVLSATNANRETTRQDKSYKENSGILDKVGQPIEALNARMSRMKEGLAQGTPAADALIGPELLSIMAGGQGTGLRMTDTEINRVVHGKGHWENLQQAINQWSLDPSKANTITTEQRKEIRALVLAVDKKLQQKSATLNQAHQDLLGTDEPDKHRKIVTDARAKLSAIDTGAEGGGSGVQVHNGFEYTKGADGQWHKGKAVAP